MSDEKINKRENYPDQRPYKSWQLKRLIRQMECNLSDLNACILTITQKRQKVNECEAMLSEIALRID